MFSWCKDACVFQNKISQDFVIHKQDLYEQIFFIFFLSNVHEAGLD